MGKVAKSEDFFSAGIIFLKPSNLGKSDGFFFLKLLN